MLALTIDAPALTGKALWEPNAPIDAGSITLGGEPSSDLTIFGARLAPRHLTLIPGGKLRALGPVVVQGRALSAGAEVSITEGAVIEAGDARITLAHAGAPQDAFSRSPSLRAITWRPRGGEDGAEALLKGLFAGLSSPLYALLDAARDRMVYRIVRGSGWPSVCLFPPEHEVRLAREAPHLLRLPDDPSAWGAAGDALVQGFGKSFGIFLTSRGEHAQIARSLRRLLTVRDDKGPLYFRYYDPRVARDFLPIATPYQASLFYDEAELLFIEGEDGRSMLQVSERRPEE